MLPEKIGIHFHARTELMSTQELTTSSAAAFDDLARLIETGLRNRISQLDWRSHV